MSAKQGSEGNFRLYLTVDEVLCGRHEQVCPWRPSGTSGTTDNWDTAGKQAGWYAALSTASVCVSEAFFSDEGNSLNQCLHFSSFMWETDILCACVCMQVGCRKKCTVIEPAGF